MRPSSGRRMASSVEEDPATGTDERRSSASHEEDSATIGIEERRSSASNGASRRLRRMDSLEHEAMHARGMDQHKMLTLAATLRLAYQSVGVVYGDIGTSPLYVFSSTFSSIGTPTKNDLLGALSLMIYTLTFISLIKYVFIVLKANDHGDGGTFALYSLICRHAKVSVLPNQNPEDRQLSSYKLDVPINEMRSALKLKAFLEKSKAAQKVLLITALLGTSMVIGDGVLTPSISVLSAFDGIKVQAPSLNENVSVVLSIIVLVMLFSLQRYGTAKIGFLFAPIVTIWLIFIALVGVYNIIAHDPSVFRAFNPKYIYDFFKNNKKNGWVALGGVVLCITGTEAMFADLGHFSVRSIQISFTGFVFPCLLIAYIGQASYLMKHPEDVSETFYKSLPGPVYWPVFVSAIAAAITASQAMISATFSIVKQSMALGCFPRVKVIHTSDKHLGQVYVPELNWILMIGCVLVTGIFRDTTRIGNAYGICVVAVMVATSALLTLIMIMIWQTKMFLALGFFVIFVSVELLYFSAVLYKFPQGGWLPLVAATVLLGIMYIWYYANACKYEYEVQNKLSMVWINGLGPNLGTIRMPGVALIYSELAQGVPLMFSHLIDNLPAMQSVLVFVCVKHLPVTTVCPEERFLFRQIGSSGYNMYRCVVRYGYRDVPKDDENFEKSLLDSLAAFIGSNMQAQDQEQQEMQPAESTTLSVYPSKFVPENVMESGESQNELVTLHKSRQAGAVYIFGNVDVQAKVDSSLMKKFVINKGYALLKNNFRKSTISLNIPHSRLLEVGMVYRV